MTATVATVLGLALLAVLIGIAISSHVVDINDDDWECHP